MIKTAVAQPYFPSQTSPGYYFINFTYQLRIHNLEIIRIPNLSICSVLSELPLAHRLARTFRAIKLGRTRARFFNLSLIGFATEFGRTVHI